MIKLEEFYKLRELLKDVTPVISRIMEIYKDVEGEHGETQTIDELGSHIYILIQSLWLPLENKRITILKWFSTVPYQSHHDLACEGRVEHTGVWLFKRKEFTSWENSKTPAILWLHGIRKSAHVGLSQLWNFLLST